MPVMNGLNHFGEILQEITNAKLNQKSMENKCRLKFRKPTNPLPSTNIIKELKHYFAINLTSKEYKLLLDKLNQQPNDQEQIGELMVTLIHYTEQHIDWNVELFEKVLNIISNIINNENLVDEQDNFIAESAIDKCSLLIYDSFQIIKAIRNKIVNICKSYPIPIYYDNAIKMENICNEKIDLKENEHWNDNQTHQMTTMDTEQRTNMINLRQSLINTFQNLQTLMIDFHILADALYFVRHYDDIFNEQETNKDE